MHIEIWECEDCGLINQVSKCYTEQGGCGYKATFITYGGANPILLEGDEADTDYHTNSCKITCTSCNGTGEENCTYGNWQQENQIYHIRYCTSCNNPQRALHDWSDGVCYSCGAVCSHNWNSATGTCTICEKTCTHTGGTHANNGTCTTCGYKYEAHGQGTTLKYKDITATTHTHYYECTFAGCAEVYEATIENHTVETWTDNGDGTHSGTCTACGENVSENHTYGADDKCTKCNATKPAEVCNHDWSMEKNETEHWEKCSKCNEIRKQSAHNMAMCTDNGNGTHTKTCAGCGYAVTENHNYGTDDKCTECNAIKPAETCEHDWTIENDETNHWEKCTKCEETRNNEAHTITLWTDNGDGTHTGTCTTCGYKSTKEHTYGTDDKCTECNSAKPTETCEHEWVVESDNTDHWEKCTKCNQIRNKENHTMTVAKDNGNGTHTKTCTKCNFKITSEHEYGTDNKCKDCGIVKATTECEHNWEAKVDETYHWDECTKCKEVKNKEKHTVTNWKNNGDGTHSGTCTKCNKTITSNHNKGTDEKCIECKADMSNNNNNNNNIGNNTNNNNTGNNNNNNNSNTGSNNNAGNNTAGGKVIPNTGSGTVITIAITATIAVLGIATVGLKKYKDIV